MSLSSKPRAISWLLGAFLLTAGSDSGLGQELTIERITSYPRLTGTAPSHPTWSPDSSRIAFLWNDEGHLFRDVWVVSVSEGEPVRVTDLAEGPRTSDRLAAPREDPLAALERAYEERSEKGVSDVTWSPDGRSLILSYDDHVFRVDADGANLRRLTSAEAGRSELAFSPDGRFLSWLQDGDLWLWNQKTNEAVQATKIGVAEIDDVEGARFTRLDREYSSYEWSEDSRFVALHLDDRRNIRMEPIPNYIGERTEMRYLRRDYPGDHDHIRAMDIYSVAGGRVRRVELPEKTAALITGYSWSSAPSRLLIDQVSEDAVHRWLWVVTPEDASFKKAWHTERWKRNSQRLTSSIWRSDGKAVLFTSDLDGRHRLHSVSVEDGSPETLTKGDWSVIAARFGGAPLGVSDELREVFFVSTKKNPYERQIYRMSEKGGTVSQVTSLPGTHYPILSPDGTKLALLHSSDTRPTDLYVMDAKGGEERRLTHSPTEEFDRYTWAKPSYVTFKSRIDDAVIHGRLVEPPDLDRTKKYAAILGPVYSNNVRNQWHRISHTFEQYLAQRGYLVLQVDLRGSSGYGRKFRQDLFLDYGGIDIEDLHSGAAYLKSLPYVDPDRVGIWGWSYGGLMTSMSLFKKPGVYAAGVAGAPATNVWHAMTGQTDNARQPYTHPEVYRKVSAVSFGEDLEDHLMFIHGLQDAVVLFKDSVTLAEKLMMLGKNFDFVILPSATHSYSQRDYETRFVLTKVTEHFDRYLGRGPRTAAPSSDEVTGGQN